MCARRRKPQRAAQFRLEVDAPAELREQARTALRERKYEDAYNDWMKEMRARGFVQTVIVLTASGGVDTVVKAMQAGATDFFVKSTQWSLLAGRLRYLLRSSRTRHELERSKAKLARAQDLARMGSFEWKRDLAGSFTISATTRLASST